MFEHRLLLVTEMYPPQVGGIQAYLGGLWGALPSASSFVVAASSPGDRAWDTAQSYRIVRAPAKAWTYPRWRRFSGSARELVRRERIEAVVCGKALFEGRAALRLADEFDIPYVVCTHAMEIATWLKFPKTRRDLFRVLAGASRITVVNEGTKRLLLDHRIPEAKLVKIYPGVSEAFFSLPTGLEEFRARFRLSGKRVVTSVARLVPRKGHAVLIEAFPAVLQAIPDVHLLFVGDGPERERLRERTERLGLVGAVTFAGALPDDDVRRAVAISEAFVLTPLEIGGDVEGFGIVYVEAAALGKPVVGSRTGGVPEAVLHDRTGLLVPPANPSAAAEAMIALLTNDTLRRRLGDAARERANREFHWKGRALLFQGMLHTAITER